MPHEVCVPFVHNRDVESPGKEASQAFQPARQHRKLYDHHEEQALAPIPEKRAKHADAMLAFFGDEYFTEEPATTARYLRDTPIHSAFPFLYPP
ncbi:unnamed protein product [Arctogadus glacialis]